MEKGPFEEAEGGCAMSAGRCCVYRGDGRICGRPAEHVDTRRGGLVCSAHMPKKIRRRNIKHARRALEAIHVYDEDVETSIVDLVADLLHLCEWKGMDFDALVCTGRIRYKAEKGDMS